MSRIDIPKQLERDVLVEAGHRCAIPTCHQIPVEIAHIIPWVQVKKHTFDNLIALCPTCHARYDSGEIDRRAMQQYKANLSILHRRYGDLERRVLQFFAENPTIEIITLPEGLELLIRYLLKDEFIEEYTASSVFVVDVTGMSKTKKYRITPAGREFVNKWCSAKTLT